MFLLIFFFFRSLTGVAPPIENRVKHVRRDVDYLLPILARVSTFEKLFPSVKMKKKVLFEKKINTSYKWYESHTSRDYEPVNGTARYRAIN